MSDDTAVVDMTHFNLDDAMDVASRERFAMPPVVIAAFRQTAQKGLLKILKLVESDKFEKLKVVDQLAVMSLVLDRAYGKSETATSSMMGMINSGYNMECLWHPYHCQSCTQTRERSL